MMYKAIYLRSGKEVKAWENKEEGEGWYTIEFPNGSSINVFETEIQIISEL